MATSAQDEADDYLKKAKEHAEDAEREALLYERRDNERKYLNAANLHAGLATMNASIAAAILARDL